VLSLGNPEHADYSASHEPVECSFLQLSTLQLLPLAMPSLAEHKAFLSRDVQGTLLRMLTKQPAHIILSCLIATAAAVDLSPPPAEHRTFPGFCTPCLLALLAAAGPLARVPAGYEGGLEGGWDAYAVWLRLWHSLHHAHGRHKLGYWSAGIPTQQPLPTGRPQTAPYPSPGAALSAHAQAV
jgi:hypothetical protein